MRATVAAVSAALLFTIVPMRGQGPPPERLAPGMTATSPSEPTRTLNWPRIYIKDSYVRDAVRGALQGASEWLLAPKCQALLSEFSDKRGRVLTERLGELKMTLAEYLGFLIVEDGETHRRAASRACWRLQSSGAA